MNHVPLLYVCLCEGGGCSSLSKCHLCCFCNLKKSLLFLLYFYEVELHAQKVYYIFVRVAK